MACVENWPTAETVNGNDNLVLVITTPNPCWQLSEIRYTLPPGMSPEELCNYNEGDLFVVAHMYEQSGCGGGAPAGSVTVPTDFVKVAEGVRVQIIVYDSTASSVKTIKRSRNSYNTGVGS